MPAAWDYTWDANLKIWVPRGGVTRATVLNVNNATTDQTSATLTNPSYKGIFVGLHVTLASAGGLILRVSGLLSVTGVPVPQIQLNADPAAVTAVGDYGYLIYPGVSGVQGGIAQATAAVVPWQFIVTAHHVDANPQTYLVDINYVP